MSPLPEVGSRVAGYVIEGVIGEGGMGVVFRARHEILEREAALKVLLEGLGNDPAFRARFLRESKLAARLSRNPHVLTVYDAGESEGLLYLAMYLVDGPSLADVLRSEGALEPERTVAILRQVASALDAAHAQGLIHRDVKPANVLLEAAADGADHCFLGDFGLGKDVGSTTRLTASRVLMGTVPYMAPEMLDPRLLKGSAIDHRVDVYALGCVLFECLTGQVPFADAETDTAMAVAHLSRPPPRATDTVKDLPQAIDAVIARGMAKDRDDRFDRCGALVEEAARALSGTQLPAPPTPPPAATVVSAPRVETVASSSAAAPTRRARDHRWPARRLLLIGIPLSIVAVVALVLLTRGGGGRPEAVWVVGGSTLTRIDPLTGDVDATVDVGPEAADVVVDGSGVWVANRVGNSVSRIDPQTNRVVATIDVGNDAVGIASDGSSIWVAVRDDGEVVRIDPARNEVADRVVVGTNPEGMAADADGVWVAAFEDATVSRIDPASSEVVVDIDVGPLPLGMAIGLGSVWVAESGSSSIARIDPAENLLIESVVAGPAPRSVVVAGSFIWVVDDTDRRLYQIDPELDQVVTTVSDLGDPTDVTFGAGLLWVTDPQSNSVVAIDPESLQKVRRVDLEESPQAVIVG